MSAPWLIVWASFLFASMGVAVKLASVHYGAGEIVMYRSMIGMLWLAAVSRWRGVSLHTPVRPLSLLGMALIVGAGIAATRLRQMAAPAPVRNSTIET